MSRLETTARDQSEPGRGTGSARFPAPSIPDSLAKGVYVVIPAFNERTSIGEVVASVLDSYSNVVVVDDGSTDGTGEMARRAGSVLLRHVVNRGQGAALQTGIAYSLAQGAEVLVTFDADGQHVVGDISRMVLPIVSGEADITLGSRFLGERHEVPLARRLLLAGGVLFTRIVSGVWLTDTHNGLRAFSRSAASALRIRLDRMAHASELIEYVHRSGLRFVEVPVHVRYTEYSLAKGQSAAGAFRIVFDYLVSKLMGRFAS